MHPFTSCSHIIDDDDDDDDDDDEDDDDDDDDYAGGGDDDDGGGGDDDDDDDDVNGLVKGKGKSTGHRKPWFLPPNVGFPVDFPLIQSNDDADDDNDSPASFPSCREEAPRMMHDASSSPSRKDGGTAVVLLKFLGSWENDGECIESTRIHGGYPGRMVGYGWLVVQWDSLW